MKLRALAPLLVLLPLAAACDAADLAPAPAAPAPAQSAAAFDGAPVSVMATGHWARTLGCSGFCVNEYNFWVDLRVRNDAFEKQVGILWTDTGWASINTAYAQYEGPLEDGWEKWGIDVTVGQRASYMAPGEIELAAFATMGGAAYWDPANNHYIYQKVTAEQPVRRLSSEVHLEAGKGVVMTGRVRVLDLAFEKAVTVRYTTDGWANWKEAQASWVKDDDWTFRVEHVAEEPLPGEVAYAVRYNVLGQEYWDNNGGADFRHALEPSFEPGYTFFNINEPLSGVLTLGGGFRTDLPLGAARARIDQGAWHDGANVTFSTAELTDGAHQAEVRVRLEGGGEVSRFIPFTVANRVTPVSRWALAGPAGASLGDAWAMAIDGAGKIYVAPGTSYANEGAILRYPAWGSDAPVAFASLPEGRRPQALTVDADGRVYAVIDYWNKALYRFTAAGALDTSFGVQGGVSLEGPIMGQPFCYAGAVAATSHHVYVADTCNQRVVRFTLTGVADGTLAMPDNGYPIPSGLFADSAGLWVLRSHQIFRVADGLNTAMTVAEVIALDPTLSGPKGFVRHASGDFWVGDGVSGLAVLGANGSRKAGFWGGNGDADLPGAFHLPQDLILLPNGDVAVLGAQGPDAARFSGTLANP